MNLLLPLALTASLNTAEPRAVADTTSLTLVATFLDLCGETRGDARLALSIADRDGWSRPPAKALQPPTFKSVHWTSVDGRVLPEASGVRVLEVATQANPGGGAAQSCSVSEWGLRAASPEDMAVVQAMLAKWVGGPPVKVDAAANFALFAFREAGNERRAVATDDPALAADIPAADVVQVMMLTALGKPMIMSMRWR